MEKANTASVQSPDVTEGLLSTRRAKSIALGTFFVVIVLVLALLLFLFSRPTTTSQPSGQQGKSASPQAASTSASSPSPILGLASNKAFYVKENNIHSYDVETKVVSKWTSYDKNPEFSPAYDSKGNEIPSISLRAIKVINGSTVGFGMCATVKGDFGCGLYTLDLQSKQVTEVKKLGKESLLLTLDFATTTNFSYLVTTDTKWQLIVSNAGKEQELEAVDITAYGRGGMFEDSEKISFSPNVQQLIQISTSSPRSPLDFNFYIYDLAKDTKVQVTNATQPEWVNDKTIIFRKAGDAPNKGLYLYDVVSKTEQKIQAVTDSAYNPEVLKGDNKVVYTLRDNYQVWLYDLNTKSNSKLSDNALHGFWVTPKLVAYEKIQVCQPNDTECIGLLDYINKSVDLLDVESQKVIDLIPDQNSVFEMGSEFR